MLATRNHPQTRRVLVVEDDAGVCSVINDVLSERGYEVICVNTDEDAYEALRRGRSSFAALLVDINLGLGTTGFDVARFARRLHPNLPVMYVTGGTPESVSTFGVDGGTYVAKPFHPTALARQLQQQIDSTS